MAVCLYASRVKDWYDKRYEEDMKCARHVGCRLGTMFFYLLACTLLLSHVIFSLFVQVLICVCIRTGSASPLCVLGVGWPHSYVLLSAGRLHSPLVYFSLFALWCIFSIQASFSIPTRQEHEVYHDLLHQHMVPHVLELALTWCEC